MEKKEKIENEWKKREKRTPYEEILFLDNNFNLFFSFVEMAISIFFNF